LLVNRGITPREAGHCSCPHFKTESLRFFSGEDVGNKHWALKLFTSELTLFGAECGEPQAETSSAKQWRFSKKQ